MGILKASKNDFGKSMLYHWKESGELPSNALSEKIYDKIKHDRQVKKLNKKNKDTITNKNLVTVIGTKRIHHKNDPMVSSILRSMNAVYIKSFGGEMVTLEMMHKIIEHETLNSTMSVKITGVLIDKKFVATKFSKLYYWAKTEPKEDDALFIKELINVKSDERSDRIFNALSFLYQFKNSPNLNWEMSLKNTG